MSIYSRIRCLGAGTLLFTSLYRNAMDLLRKCAAQCLGALLASAVHDLSLRPVLARLQPGATLNFGATRPIDDRWLTALTWEALLTFFLMLVLMAVATDFRAVGGMAGLAIGGMV